MKAEEQLQRAVVKYLTILEAQGHLYFFHPANGEKRDKRTGAKLKAMGVRPGVADLVLLFPGGRTAFIELKAEGSYLSKTQKAFGVIIRDMGYTFAICRSLTDVKDTVDAWRKWARANAGPAA